MQKFKDIKTNKNKILKIKNKKVPKVKKNTVQSSSVKINFI